MNRLLLIADDFTGALDTGVQFAARGAVTRVVTDPACDLSRVDRGIQVLVLMTDSRHRTPGEAYDIVFRAVQGALAAGFTHIYKKTDSALRGNVGSELTAVMDAAQAGAIALIPALPKMNRYTRNGIHYIDGVPVAESVFGKDPFEPVRYSAVADILGQSSRAPVVLHRQGDPAAWEEPGIQVYDAVTEEDLFRTGAALGAEGVRLSAGCAGFGAVLAELLDLRGTVPPVPALCPDLFVVCGSVNPVTLRQMRAAEEDGFVRIRLNPQQKLERSWTETEECAETLRHWLALARTGRCLLDVNDPDGCEDTANYAGAHGLTVEDLRVGIAGNLAVLVKRLLDGGLNATLLCTGGDTLLAVMREVNVTELTPVGEVAAGSVLTAFCYGNQTYHMVAKSGGFGEPELFVKLAGRLGAGEKEEEKRC